MNKLGSAVLEKLQRIVFETICLIAESMPERYSTVINKRGIIFQNHHVQDGANDVQHNSGLLAAIIQPDMTMFQVFNICIYPTSKDSLIDCNTEFPQSELLRSAGSARK